MIIVKLMGGLGNQMFQYATARHLAEKNKVPLKLDLSFLMDRTPRPEFTYRNYELGVFNIKEDFATIKEVEDYTIKPRRKISKLIYTIKKIFNPSYHIKEKHYHFDSEVLNAPSNIYMDGYWQSEKYFKSSEFIIRSDFTLKNKAEGDILKLQNRIQSLNSVSIHIRRGDYISSKATNAFHGICSLEYYYNAINYIIEKVSDPYFFIFSDDMHWVKDNITINAPHSFVENKSEVPACEDMRLMSACKHHIIANSSFSWWAAWLNDDKHKIVVAPEKWFNDPEIDTRDLIPGAWIRI